MKSLKSILSLFAITLLLASALAFGLETPPIETAAAVSLFVASFYCFTYFGIIPFPKDVLGVFMGVPGVSGSEGVGIQVVSTERDRAIHLNNSLKTEYTGKKLVPGYLRLEATIINNNGKLSFPTFTGDSNLVYLTEKRLNRNDAFIASEYGLFLLKQDIANKKTNGLLYSYPNRTIFGAATDDLMAIFMSGKLNMEIDKERWLPDVDCTRFLKFPQVQQSAAGNFDEWSLKKALMPLTPQFVINGNGSNEIKVEYDTYAGFAGASAVAGTEHRAVLYLHGFYIAEGNSKSSS